MKTRQLSGVPVPEETPVLSVEEAGSILGLCRSSAYQAVERGEIPVVRFGRRVVVPTAGLRRLLGLEPADRVNESPA